MKSSECADELRDALVQAIDYLEGLDQWDDIGIRPFVEDTARLLREVEGEPMASYILRNIDQDLWRRVKSKAALEGITLKALIERLLLAWLET